MNPIFDGGLDFNSIGFIIADAGIDGEIGITDRISALMGNGIINIVCGRAFIWKVLVKIGINSGMIVGANAKDA